MAAVHARYKDGFETNFDVQKGPSNKWWLPFKKRHGVTHRKPDSLDRGQKDFVDVDDFFTYIKTEFSDMSGWEKEKEGMEHWPPTLYGDMAEYLVASVEVDLQKRLMRDYKDGKSFSYYDSDFGSFDSPLTTVVVFS
ncbi:hypothetical protein Bbelb_377340 [Branchiostoma belcheri]|nr:hypothetical protein Bbelb_377340 [Branchiostoma belcheri]